MKLLAWDTSSKAGAIVAVEWDPSVRAVLGFPKIVSEWSLSVDAAHSDRLLWGIHHTLEAARWKLADLDYLGVGLGPGSFTGLRIGVSTARALSYVLRKPLVGVSSLAALARPSAAWASALGRKLLIVVANDACKNEIYGLWGTARSVRDCVGWAEGDLPGAWKRGVEEKVLAPAAFAAALKRKYGEGMDGWLAVGDAVGRYPDVWKSLPVGDRIEPPFLASSGVSGGALGQLAWEGVQAGMARSALLVRPRYLREADAVLKLRAGLLPKGPARG